MTNHVRKSASRVRRIVRAPFQYALKVSTRRVLKITVFGRENLRNLTTPFIVIANHSSHFDTPLIMGALPRRLSRQIATAAAADYFFANKKSAFLTGLFFNTFPVDRGVDKSHCGIARDLLDKGIPLLIMPEGTRSRDGKIGEFKIGAAKLARGLQIPIVPIAIAGAHAAWPPHAKRWVKGRPPIRVMIGAPMLAKTSETAEKFNTRVRDTTVKLCDEISH